MPDFMRSLLMTAIVWQGRLNARITDAAQQLRHGASPSTWLTLLAFSFAYSVLHAIGPGHGKLVTGAYLGSRATRAAQAVALAGWTAAVQAMSAIVLVFGAAWFAEAGTTNLSATGPDLSAARAYRPTRDTSACTCGASRRRRIRSRTGVTTCSWNTTATITVASR